MGRDAPTGRPAPEVAMTRRIRPMAVAGTFYPRDPATLAAAIDRYVADGDDGDDGDAPHADPPPAVIAPHAGYVYSGPVAGSVYARLAPYRGRIARVVIVGPAHRAFVDGIVTVGVDELATPFGALTVDVGARDEVLLEPIVHVDDAAHAQEHCIEVQLPFIQRVLGDVAVLPLLAGRVEPELMAQVLAHLWGSNGTLVLISTDLSHYHDIDTARHLDSRTAMAIVAGHLDVITHDAACGATPLRGALLLAARRGAHAQLVDLATSADTIGPADRVVGYGGFEIR
jgi:AmmeMemoRadiSam system protein B